MTQHMELNINCEYCTGSFKMSELELRIKQLGDGIEETYFTCPKCDQFYTVIKTNVKIRELKKKQEFLLKRIRGRANPVITDKETENWEARQKEIRMLIDELNGR